MTIIIFLIDTSASMSQKTYLGTSLLDVAKGAVENFIKIRARDVNSRWDRYMLLTFEDPPSNIKAGWKESHATFMTELKNLTAHGLTCLGPSLKYTFDLLNVNRMQSCIDTYGQGRSPYYLEPAVIICITDGRKMTSSAGVHNELNLPMNNVIPGSELTKEPFRWDQRIFGLVLRIPAVPTLDNPSQFISSAEDSPIDAMCEVTGGRSYCIITQRMLQQCLESLVQKCQSGVVINFEKIGPDPVDEEKDERPRSSIPASAWQNCRRMIYVPRSVQKGIPIGHWPIPESFWPDLTGASLPSRNAQPNVKFTCTAADAMVLENLPFDKYELEASPLTQFILERRQPNVVWQTFVAGSAKYSEGLGLPFGYLKASSNMQTVNLYVMPYNYPVLIPLLDELLKVHQSKPNTSWRQKFESYLKTMPIYYAAPLKRALARLGPTIPSLVPDPLADQCLSYSVVSYLKKLKNQAKIEFDRVNASVGQRAIITEGIKITQRTSTSFIERKNFTQLLEALGDLRKLRQEMNDYNVFFLRVPDPSVQLQLFKNPYDISRSKLVEQITKMRMNFLKDNLRGRLQEAEWLHNQAVGQMGNYQDYLKKIPPPLREIDMTPARLHTFGNPFKVNKNLMIDEADEAMPGQTASRKRSAEASPASPRPNKRKPGPLPKDVPARLLMSPTPHVFDGETRADTPTVIPSSPEPSPSTPPPALNNHTEPASSTSSHSEAVVTNSVADKSKPAVVKPKAKLPTVVPVNGFNAKVSVSVEEGNLRCQQQAFREVRRPGKNYSQLFAVLQSLQGSIEAQQACIHAVKLEALRFKRQTLAKLIEQFQTSLVHSRSAKTQAGKKASVSS